MGRRARALLATLVVLAALAVGLALRPSSTSAPEAHDGPNPSKPDWAAGFEMNGVLLEEQFAAVSGSLRGPNTTALPDGIVCLRTARLTSTERLALPMCAHTSGGGAFSFSRVIPGEYRLHAVVAGFRPTAFPVAPARLVLRPGTEKSDVVLRMRAGGVPVSGVVEDFFGGPVESATVSVVAGRTGLTAAVLTDSEGRFEVWTDGGRQPLTAAAHGYAAASTVSFAPATGLRFRLLPEAVVEGTVIDGTSGAPVAGARVKARQTRGKSAAGTGGTVLSDSAGRFRIGGLMPSDYRLSARLGGNYGTVDGAVQLSLGEVESELVLELNPVPVVAGAVLVEGTDPEPCTDGTVTLIDPGADINWRAKIRADGSVELPVLAEGSYGVTVDCLRHSSANHYPELRVVGDSGPPPQTWYVRRGASISGRVLDPDGKPSVGAEIRAAPALQHAAGAEFRGATSGEDGTFTLLGLSAGEDYLLRALSADAAPLDEPLIVRAPASDVEVHLPATGSVSGTIKANEAGALPPLAVLIDGMQATTSDPGTGEFTIASALPGVREVTLQTTSGGPVFDVEGELASGVVEVLPAIQAAADFTIAGQFATLVGVVVDSEGSPVPRAIVSVRPETGAVQPLQGLANPTRLTGAVPTSEDGTFEVPGLQDGEKYSLRAVSETGGEGTVEHATPGDAIEVQIEATGSVVVNVVLPEGQPNSFRVAIENVRTGTRKVGLHRDSKSEARYENLAPGAYQVFARTTSGSATALVEVESGQTASVDLLVQAYGRVEGRLVRGDDGSPVPGVRVVARLSAGGSATHRAPPALSNQTKADGSFVVKNVAHGRVTVGATPRRAGMLDPQLGSLQVSIDVEPGGIVQVGDLKLPKRRRERGEQGGDFGFAVAADDPYGDQRTRELRIVSVRVGGPASRAGLALGDVVVAVDDDDVTGNSTYLFASLVDTKPGQTIELELAGGDVVLLVAE